MEMRSIMLREQLGFLSLLATVCQGFFYLKSKKYIFFVFYSHPLRVCVVQKNSHKMKMHKRNTFQNRKCLSFLLCPELMVPPIICYSDFFSPSSRKCYATECEQRRRGECGTIMDAKANFCGKDERK